MKLLNCVKLLKILLIKMNKANLKMQKKVSYLGWPTKTLTK